jgi:RNA polymerase sigma factor (sigma-70 family)
MQPIDDNALLRQYVENRSDEAFAKLVTRHINLVYSVALRQIGDPHHAEEITQAVFIIFAQKAAQLREIKALGSWLFQVARLTANNFARSESRRSRREQEAYMQSILNESETEVWPSIAPLLDTAVASLREKDRQAIVLRFYEGKNLREVGSVLEASDDAAEKRVHRALEKLRKFFMKRGVTLTTAIIVEAISSNSVQAAPVGLAATISATAVKSSAVAASTLTLIKGALKIMAWTKAKTAIVGVVIAGMATFSIIQHQAQVKLREQNESLQRQMIQLKTESEQFSTQQRAQTPHLPAPQTQMTTSTNTLVEDLPSTNLLDRLKDKNPKLTREQVEAYLKANGRNAANLLAAFRTSGDPALLKEAMEKYPNDPQVAYEAVTDKDLSPEEQRQWLNALEKSAPNNALANYLSALNYFNSGQIDQGVREFTAASGKSLDDYNADRVESDAEVYLAAGYSMADAKELAASQLLQPQLTQLKQLGMDAVDLANAYRQTGDSASAQTVLQMAVNLGQSYATSSPGEYEIGQLVGISIEQRALQAMNPNSSYGDNGQTVQDQLNELAQQKVAINELAHQASILFPAMSDQDWIIYRDRAATFGMTAADQWLINKYGQQ